MHTSGNLWTGCVYMTKLKYKSETWNAVTGCTKVSEACKNCYAEAMALRFQQMGVERFKNGFDITFHPQSLDKPTKWKSPRLIFANSMSDIFHSEVPFEYVDKIFEVITDKAPRHMYMILTKRPKRMLEYFRSRNIEKPIENLVLGVTAETQKRADERIPILLDVPARTRWVNCEPLLEFIYVEKYLKTGGIHWVCAGGETARSYRITQKNWVVALINQCKKYDIAFKFMGWSGKNRKEMRDNMEVNGKVWNEYPQIFLA